MNAEMMLLFHLSLFLLDLNQDKLSLKVQPFHSNGGSSSSPRLAEGAGVPGVPDAAKVSPHLPVLHRPPLVSRVLQEPQ